MSSFTAIYNVPPSTDPGSTNLQAAVNIFLQSLTTAGYTVTSASFNADISNSWSTEITATQVAQATANLSALGIAASPAQPAPVLTATPTPTS